MESLNFVAIDLETATSSRNSICEIGIAVVKNSEIIESKSWLVKPEGNRYDNFNISIHHITPEITQNASSFPIVWKEVEMYLTDGIVVAHNSSFDMYVLKEAFLAILLFETLLSYTVPRLFKGGGGSSKRDRNLFVGAVILLLMPLFCFKYLNCLLHFWLSSYLLEFWAVGSLFILHFKLQEEYERME